MTYPTMIQVRDMLQDIAYERQLRRCAEEIGASHSHLSNIANGLRPEPGYSLVVNIIRLHDKNMGFAK